MELFKSRTRVAYTNAVGDKVYPVVVDIKKGIKSTEDIQFVSSDVNTGILSVAFISGNENFNVSGADVVCSVMRPDASTLELPCEVVRENIVEVPLGINGTSQDGVYSFDFKVLKGGNKVIGTPIMNYSVSLSIGNDMVVEEDDRLPVLTMLMTQLTELKGEARESINQANTATVASKEATAKAIEATNNMNATINTANQKMLEVDNAKNEMTATVTNKVNEVEGRFNALTSSQQQSSEVIDARDGETSLKARLDRDIEKAKQVYVPVEGNHISTDSSVGYAKNVEILGNTVQDTSNLADIRSVGDKVEGQELYEIPVLSVGKNIWNPSDYNDLSTWIDGNYMCKWIKLKPNTTYTITSIYKKIPQLQCVLNVATGTWNGAGVQILHAVFNYTTASTTLGLVKTGEFTTPSDGVVCLQYYENNHRLATADLTEWINEICDIQLEEGTVATPYEPYQEDKLTILSPVQLEKVGDVRDRIIEKNGVWGVEKNIKSRVFDGSEDWVKYSVSEGTATNTTGFALTISDIYNHIDTSELGKLICNRFATVTQTVLWNVDSESISVSTSKNIRLRIAQNKLNTLDVNGFKSYLATNPMTIIYQLETPQFIPLPHSQQIKLRTFANKTNISFLTEIEGTIKAQVPKSLGATVNTHTEQINNLNKELDRVKKLEESTVSTVTTESDFTTVEATSNGYFEDVKLEGKTLVNLAKTTTITLSSTSSDNRIQNVPCIRELEKGKVYTLFAKCTDYSLNGVNGVKFGNWGLSGGTVNDISICKGVGGVVYKFTIKENATITLVQVFVDADNTEGSATLTDFMILEGDHTQNPPSYFEGLKSVGQSASEDEADEIVVSSVKGDGNLVEYIELNGVIVANGQDYTDNKYVRTNYITVEPNQTYYIKLPTNALYENCIVYFYDSNKSYLGYKGGLTSEFTTVTNTKFIRIDMKKADNTGNTQEDINNCDFVVSKCRVSEYISYQSDKKRLLYYNEETQAWEKPILRQWDSIEKHADGKYYYHQRSGEIVLNGSEFWELIPTSNSQYVIGFNGGGLTTSSNALGVVCDKFPTIRAYGENANFENIFLPISNRMQIRILKSKLFTQDIAGFKQWLQANNVTVVYQLAEEKVYECTNIDLITYANETNYIVESGVLSPKTTLKVHNNISNVVSLLQKKVSLLESNVKASQEVQDMMILETDMRMLDIELALMEFAPMKLNLGGSNMLRSATYFNFLKNHIVNETYEKEYLENVMNKYLATGRINQDEYDELYKMLYPPVYDIELPIER